jgi:hypothetical protein
MFDDADVDCVAVHDHLVGRVKRPRYDGHIDELVRREASEADEGARKEASLALG